MAILEPDQGGRPTEYNVFTMSTVSESHRVLSSHVNGRHVTYYRDGDLSKTNA